MSTAWDDVRVAQLEAALERSLVDHGKLCEELHALRRERDALKAELARHEESPSATMIRWSIMKSQLAELLAAAEIALSDLECADNHCWCFTRAAMNRPPCECANCKAWLVLNKVVP